MVLEHTMTHRLLALLAMSTFGACHSRHTQQCAEGMQYVVSGFGGECRPLTGTQGREGGKPTVSWVPPSGTVDGPVNLGGLHPRVEWSASGRYNSNDVVTSGGVSYVCIGARGCTGAQLSNELVWQQVPQEKQPGGDAKVVATPPPLTSRLPPPPAPERPSAPGATAATGTKAPSAVPTSPPAKGTSGAPGAR